MQRLYSVLAILLKGGILTGFGITPNGRDVAIQRLYTISATAIKRGICSGLGIISND